MAELKRYTSDNIGPMLQQLPQWLSEATRAYLVHTEGGASIRAVAKAIGSHPSTVSRQVRKIEIKREDPLVDMALDDIGACFERGASVMSRHYNDFWDQEDGPVLTPLMADILSALNVPGTVLAVVRDMENAVVVRDGPEGSTEKLTVVERETAMTMAMQDWIVPDDAENRIVRYRIAPAGRVALRDRAPMDLSDRQTGDRSMSRRSKYGSGDTPLMQLSRRRDVTGDPFLSADLIRAGERLREDYELAMLDKNAPGDWQVYVGEGSVMPDANGRTPAERAHERVALALNTLGPGLADVALICCCRLEGLEKAEKALGWAARSGKIVLRIALTHLVRHYGNTGADMMIG